MAQPSQPAAVRINATPGTPAPFISKPLTSPTPDKSSQNKGEPLITSYTYTPVPPIESTDAQAGLPTMTPKMGAKTDTSKRRSRRCLHGTWVLFAKNGAWASWIAFVGCVLFCSVLFGCMNSKVGFVDMHVAAIAMPEATFRMGYFGLCVQTPKMLEGNKDDWVCSNFRKDTTKGLADDVIRQLLKVKMFQRHAIVWYLPVAASASLFVAWMVWFFTRDREGVGRKIARGLMGLFCAAGLAASMAPMMVSNTLYFIGPLYNTAAVSKFNVANVGVQWAALGVGLTWIVASQWYDRHVGGPGCYPHSTSSSSAAEEEDPAQEMGAV